MAICGNRCLGEFMHYKIKEWQKKVLLRERKRHTAHRVASTPSAVLSQGGWGTPSLARVVPHPWPHPHLRQGNSPPPRKGHGTSGSIIRWRRGKPPPRNDIWDGDGVHPPYEGTHTCENITFPHPFGMRVVLMKSNTVKLC